MAARARGLGVWLALVLATGVGCQAILGIEEGKKRPGGEGGATSSTSAGGGGSGGACDPAACPAPMNPCEEAICDAGGLCDVQNLPENAPCGTEGGTCDAQGVCIPPACMDGAQNGGELGVDCGGPCPPCPAVLLLASAGTGPVVAGTYEPGGSWTVTTLQSPTSSRPALAITADGTGVGLIRAADDTLLYTTWELLGGWESFVPVAGGLTTSEAPALGAAGAAAQAVYRRADGAYDFALFSAGDWSITAEPVGEPASAGPAAPGIAAVGADATVAFLNGAASDRLFVRRRVGAAWQVEEDLAGTPDPTIGPEIVALAPSQDLLAIYVQVNRAIGFVRWDGAVWSVPAVIPGTVADGRPALAALPGGQAALAYRGGSRLYFTRYDGAAWTPPAEIAQDADTSPAIAAGAGDAEVEVAFVGIQAGQGTARHMRLVEGAWTAPSNVYTAAGLTNVALASAP